MSFATNKKTNRDQTFDHLVVVDSLVLGQYCVFYNPGSSVFTDSGFSIVNQADPTKVLKFNNAGATTGTTETIALSQTANRVFTLPDITGTAITDAGTQTLTGAKTFSSTATFTSPTNQLTLQPNGVGNTTKISASVIGQSTTYSFIDPGIPAVNIQTSVRQTTTAIGATSLLAQQSGSIVNVIQIGSPAVVTLPPVQAGLNFTFIIVTSAAGTVSIETFATGKMTLSAAASSDAVATTGSLGNAQNSITFVGNSTVGDMLEVYSDGSFYYGRWQGALHTKISCP